MKNKRILFFTPYYLQSRGNSTTAKRIVNGLEGQGLDVNVFAYEEDTWNADWDDQMRAADLYHVLHLRRFAEWLKKHPHINLTKPYILTSGGTDINEDLKNPDAAKLMKSVTGASCALTVFSIDGRDKIIAAYPELTERVFVISQSVWLPEYKGAAPVVTSKGFPKLLLPAGLRPVKDVLFLVEELIKMREEWPRLTFSIIGIALDDVVTGKVRAYEAQYEWFHYIEEVELEQMKDVYENYDIVLNTSISEGQPTSLLEAMYVGKPVMARKIPGNESIITHNKTGLLFETASEWRELLNQLLHDQTLRVELCEAAKEYIITYHATEREMSQFLRVYEHCLA